MKIIDEINKYRDIPLENDFNLRIEASQFGRTMAVKGTLSHGRVDVIFSTFDIELGRKFWVGTDRLLDPKITRIGVATCEFRGVLYWCAITR